ncbi:hypothetical protein [Lysinibacillus sp. G4S2]|uniref:hypothetical protein n=1 Tax=Lysinibacillus sp. G4S2 TaxID=3055859 RepID=UPI0025A1D4BB|nr:hypothetical protein [Lysinibacillus sp. G4S2]MDM5245717.1 hypothetical protein [Lysinibacillus sp. G4S2]
MKKELIKLIENSSAEITITKEHLGIVEMLLQISTPVRLDNLLYLTKANYKKEKSSSI